MHLMMEYRATSPIFNGICMEEHTCEAKLTHINGNVVRKEDISGDKRLMMEYRAFNHISYYYTVVSHINSVKYCECF